MQFQIPNSSKDIHAPIILNPPSGFSHDITRELCSEKDVDPSFFTLLQPEMVMGGAKSGWCD